MHGEDEEVVLGHVELANVLWEMGILPDIRVLPDPTAPPAPPAPSREAALQAALARFPGDQWALWPLGAALEARTRQVLESHFDELFAGTAAGFIPRWITPGHDILITWAARRGAA